MRVRFRVRGSKIQFVKYKKNSPLECPHKKMNTRVCVCVFMHVSEC